MRSEKIDLLAKALCKMQSQLTGALKDSKNPFFNSSYADLESVWDSIRKPLTENGLSVSQIPCESSGGAPALETILMHESGQFISNIVPVISQKNDPQGYGSAFTYFRRYALAAMVGQIQVDDDSEGSMNRQNQSKTPKTAQVERSNNPSGVYIIPFGKFKGKGLGEVNAEDLKSYAEYIRQTAEKDNKPINDTVQELLERIDAL